jgi:hypothetical protein
MNSTSCPRRFGWIETNWCRRIDLSSTVQLNASGRSSSFPVSESMSLSKHRADLDLYLLMRNLRAWSDSQIATLYPGCFALVDSAVAALWYLEARRLPCTPDIHADVLESGVPARYVRLGQPASFACGRLFAVACDLRFHGLGCACSLGRDISWARYGVLAQLSRVRAVELPVVDQKSRLVNQSP